MYWSVHEHVCFVAGSRVVLICYVGYVGDVGIIRVAIVCAVVYQLHRVSF